MGDWGECGGVEADPKVMSETNHFSGLSVLSKMKKCMFQMKKCIYVSSCDLWTFGNSLDVLSSAQSYFVQLLRPSELLWKALSVVLTIV